MAVLSPARRLLHALRAFRASRRANVTVTFALALVPIVGSVGAAVDYSRANAVKVALQAAADSTVLMLSKEVGSLNQTIVLDSLSESQRAHGFHG
jgi:Flp pilus assembly protein TadG